MLIRIRVFKASLVEGTVNVWDEPDGLTTIQTANEDKNVITSATLNKLIEALTPETGEGSTQCTICHFLTVSVI